MDFLIRTGSLMAELIAGNVKDFQSLVLQAVVHSLQVFILRSEAAAGCRIDDEQHLPLVCSETYLVAFLVFQIEIVNCCHNSFLCLILILFSYHLNIKQDCSYTEPTASCRASTP